MPSYPQVQENVPVPTRNLPPSLLAEIERLNTELGERGRVLVRPSGTEPVVRVLAEARDISEARELCGTISGLVLRELG
jgi:phosphoglucosamine mutase